MTKSRGIGRGGKREGAGNKTFVPTPEQRTVVKLLIGSGRPHEEIITAIKNPSTGERISLKTLYKAFKEEIVVGKVEMNTIASFPLKGAVSKKKLPRPPGPCPAG